MSGTKGQKEHLGGKGGNLETFDEEPENLPPTGTPDSPRSKSPENILPIPRSNLYQFKQNFGLSLMGVLLVGSNLNRLSRELNEPVYYHLAVIILIGISLLIEVIIIFSSLMMSSYNINVARHVMTANRINNLILYCTFVLIIIRIAVISFDLSYDGIRSEINSTSTSL